MHVKKILITTILLTTTLLITACGITKKLTGDGSGGNSSNPGTGISLTILISPNISNGLVVCSPNSTSFSSGDTVLLVASANPTYVFDYWLGDIVGSTNITELTMNTSKTITAVFRPTTATQHPINTFIIGSGSISKTPSLGTYTDGTNVALVASPSYAWKFDGWTGDVTASTITLPLSVNSTKNITATFSKIPTLDIDFVEWGYSSHGSIASSGVTINISPNIFSCNPGDMIEISITTNTTAKYVFEYWTGVPAAVSTNATLTTTVVLGNSIRAVVRKANNIYTAKHLALIGTSSLYPMTSGTTYYLQNDIDLAGYDNGDHKGWKPIDMFNANFEGNNYTIRNMTIRGANVGDDIYMGLFGRTRDSYAYISNIRLENVDVKGYRFLGGLVGSNYADVTNCHVSGKIQSNTQSVDGIGGLIGDNSGRNITYCSTSVNVSGGADIGGLIGSNSQGNISNCHVSGNIESDWFNSCSGGIVGSQSSSTGTKISKSSFHGTVYGSGNYIGGIIGSNAGEGFTECYAIATVSCDGDYVGGLAGENINDPPVNSYFKGTVRGKNSVGGLIGKNSGITSVNYCYSEGTVEGLTKVGGLIGENSGRIQNCVALNTTITRTSGLSTDICRVIGLDNSGRYYNNYALSTMVFSGGSWPVTSGNIYGISVNATTAGSQGFYTGIGWDFGSTWKIDSGISPYPILQ